MKRLLKIPISIFMAALLFSSAAFGEETTQSDQKTEVIALSETDCENESTAESSSPESASMTESFECESPAEPSESDTPDEFPEANPAESDMPDEIPKTNTAETDTPDEAPETNTAETDTPDIETAPQASESELTKAFVKRLYETLLLRTPDEKGLNDWTNLLQSGKQTGADIICGFIGSDEFKGRKNSDEKYVELLYHALFDRNPDSEGYNAWLRSLNEGLSRNYVCAGFINSKEFHELCDRFKIKPGTLGVSGVLDENPDIVHFVNYLYEYILSRKCDKNGLTGWVTQLSTKKETAAQVVYGFVFSKEFLSKNLSDEDYVKVLYKTILNRTPDKAGLNDWCSVLDYGVSRLCVLRGFIQSPEFGKLCSKYKITAGTITLTEARDMNQQVTKYVALSYKNCLNRKASVSELNDWCAKLNHNTTRAASLLQNLLFSAESNPDGLSHEAYINRLYLTVLQRLPSAQELNNRIAALSKKSRKALFTEFCASQEFRTILINYGLNADYYQNPSNYYQIRDSIAPLTGGGYDLSSGYEGLKVAWVIKKLGVNNGNYIGMKADGKCVYGPKTTEKVKEFQKANNLPETGIVDLTTWLKMGYTENDWYHLGAYVTPVKTVPASTKEDHIETMIATAYTYLDTPYVVGASGKPGQGVDCSGLVMQALYSSGIDMSPINPVRHSKPGYEYESANIWASSKMMHVPYEKRQRGDLIFYQNSQGTVIHIAIYLGDDQVIESTVPANKVIVAPIKNSYRNNIKGVARPFV